jgi:hypothetical protein
MVRFKSFSVFNSFRVLVFSIVDVFRLKYGWISLVRGGHIGKLHCLLTIEEQFVESLAKAAYLPQQFWLLLSRMTVIET